MLAKPTRERPNTVFRYLSDAAVVVQANEFEYVLDKFIEQVRGLLREQQIADSNLDRIWIDVIQERHDPESTKRRRLEALLGREPDQAEVEVEKLLTDAAALGDAAINELAADNSQGGQLLTAESLNATAKSTGFDASPQDVVRLASNIFLSGIGEVPAWKIGAEAAKALRDQEHLAEGPIDSDLLGSNGWCGEQSCFCQEPRTSHFVRNRQRSFESSGPQVKVGNRASL